jgi:hypothetical protein
VASLVLERFFSTLKRCLGFLPAPSRDAVVAACVGELQQHVTVSARASAELVERECRDASAKVRPWAADICVVASRKGALTLLPPPITPRMSGRIRAVGSGASGLTAGTPAAALLNDFVNGPVRI